MKAQMLELATAAAKTCAELGPGDPIFDGCFWRDFLTSPMPAALIALVLAIVYSIFRGVRRRRARTTTMAPRG
jgi:hypothetical protein